MGTEAEAKQNGLGSFGEEDMYNSEAFINSQEEEEQVDLEGFDGVNFPKEDEDDNHEEEENEEEEEENINFEEEEENEEDVDLDLSSFNKKFNKDFKTSEELKAFMDGKEIEETKGKDDEILSNAEAQLSFLQPLLEIKDGRYAVNDESLMRKEYETIALRNGDDLNDEEVQIEINEKIEELKDKGTLGLYSENLRNKLKSIVSDAENSKSTIESKREEVRLKGEKLEKENLQNILVDFHNLDSFYGIKMDKKAVSEVYRDIASGKFMESLKADPKTIAELALMGKFKEQIFKKSSGLTYNDGVKSIVDDFKSKQKESTVAKAQKRSSSGSSANSESGLIDSILYTKPKEKETV